MKYVQNPNRSCDDYNEKRNIKAFIKRNKIVSITIPGADVYDKLAVRDKNGGTKLLAYSEQYFDIINQFHTEINHRGYKATYSNLSKVYEGVPRKFVDI